jgi:hypothetical protein
MNTFAACIRNKEGKPLPCMKRTLSFWTTGRARLAMDILGFPLLLATLFSRWMFGDHSERKPRFRSQIKRMKRWYPSKSEQELAFRQQTEL